MRRVAPKPHWYDRSVLSVLALAVGIAALLLLSSSAKADPPPFPVYASVDVDDTDCLVNSDIERTFGIDDDPWPAAMYQNHVSFVPGEWYVATADDAPIGAVVGKHERYGTLGWFNSPCSGLYGAPLQLEFDPLLNCSIDTSDTIAYTDPNFFGDGDGNGIHDGCDKYPEFLNTMFPGMTPRARMGGFEFIGINVSMNILIFEPGTPLPLPDLPSFSPDRGYIAISVLNDPTAPLVKNQITDMCPPQVTETVDYGLTLDNPLTGATNESGYPWRTNPEFAGTYTFYDYANSIRDADGDGIDNELDTCPHIANEGDPRVLGSGDNDHDGLDNACDPTPDTADVDPDGDGFPNRQDNCPLVDNEDQTDSDYDGIGDACDQDDWNDDGDTDDPGEPTGFDPDTPDGDMAEAWLEADVEIYGPSCEKPLPPPSTPTPTPTATVVGAADTDGDTVPDDDEELYGSDPEDADSTPESLDYEADTCTDGEDNDGDGLTDDDDPGCAVEEATPTPSPTVQVEICAPVFPGTYSGLVRIDGQPAAAGYEVTASIDGMDWGSAIVSGGRYAVDIPDHMPSSEPCFEAGTITFELNGMTCTPPADWASGIHNVDLSCAAAAPPAAPPVTPAPAVTPTPAAPTPTVTPTTVPPTGAGGLSGSSSRLPLWAMALASWAGLTIVAGLGTLVAVKRR